MDRLKVLISAYTCEPGRGSEPGVGWNAAREAARYHDVWVVTRAHHRWAIEDELRRRPIPNLRVVDYELPRITRRWAPQEWGVQLHYYLWQVGVLSLVRRLHRDIRFDVAHHVTLVKYWQPTFLRWLDVPYVFGPVGGGDTSPVAFRRDLPWKGRLYEAIRNVAIWAGEHDPMVIAAARRSALALAATPATEERLRRLGASRVEVCSAIALSDKEQTLLQRLALPPQKPIRFITIGRLFHLKAVHLGLRAFAAAHLAGAEYWLVGDGPARVELQRLAVELGISKRIRFWGHLSRTETLEKLSMSHVLVHPSLHESGSYACLEALAAGRPVVCLDLAGPASLVSKECGIKVKARTPGDAVADMASAMRRLAGDAKLRHRLGESGRARVSAEYRWRAKGRLFSTYYEQVANGEVRSEVVA